MTDELKIDRELDRKERAVLEYLLEVKEATKKQLDSRFKDKLSSNTVTKYVRQLSDELHLIAQKPKERISPVGKSQEVYYVTKEGEQAYDIYKFHYDLSVEETLEREGRKRTKSC